MTVKYSIYWIVIVANAIFAISHTCAEDLLLHETHRIWATGGAYFLCDPGEPVIDLVKHDRNRTGTTTELQAILVGPERRVIETACLADDNKARGSGVDDMCNILSTAEPLHIRVDPAITYQTLDGFGASDAWRCQFVGEKWPVEKRERIAELLFSREMDEDGSPKGIGLSIWRFNIGAGTAEQGSDSDIRNPWRRAECFQSTDGSYDWSKQAGQQWFLDAAHRYGVEKFVAFVNSPPVQFTRNGKGYASKGDSRLNLQPDKVDDYTAFLVDVLAHFEKEGQPFDYLSPSNEPQWAWDDAGQEGTPALNSDLCDLTRVLSKSLEVRNLSTQIVLGEAGTIGHIAKVMDDDGRDNQAQVFFNPSSEFYVGDLPNVSPLICAHDYFSVWPLGDQAAHRRTLPQALAAADPNLGYWMSEYCILQENDEIGKGARRDLGMDTALYVARIIHHDLTLAQARSWQWWTAVSQCDFKDGLVYLDDGSRGETGRMGPKYHSLTEDGAVRESKLLWMFGNYSRFLQPGTIRIGCTVKPEQSYEAGVLVSAYKAVNGEIVLVIVNLSSQEVRCQIGMDQTVDVYTTSSAENLIKTRQDGNDVRVPARAVSTCILQ